MAFVGLDGSPTPRKRSSVQMNFLIHTEDDIENDPYLNVGGGVGFDMRKLRDLDLTGHSFAPQSRLKRDDRPPQGDVPQPLITSRLANKIPTAVRNDSFKKQKVDAQFSPTKCEKVSVRPTAPSPMDTLLTALADQQSLLTRQTQTLNDQTHTDEIEAISHSDSEHHTSVTDPYATTPRTGSRQGSEGSPDAVELFRLKKELEQAQSKIARMDQELSQSRITKHTMEQAMGSQFDPEFDHTRDLRPQAVESRTDHWVQSVQPASGPVHGVALPRSNAWNTDAGFGHHGPGVIGQGPFMLGNSGWPQAEARNLQPPQPDLEEVPIFQTGPTVRQQGPSLRLDTSALGPFHYEPSPMAASHRSGGQHSRPSSAFGNHLQPWNSFSTGGTASDQIGNTKPLSPLLYGSLQQNAQTMPSFQQMHPMQHMHEQNMLPSNMQSYHPSPAGTRLSPTAAEFHGPGGYSGPGPWNMQPQPISDTPSSYLTTAEPMNYRRLLDRNMSCNWKYIVDKIVHSNDQQASIFLQQKLKVGTQEQKFEIVQAIIDQAYSLMINRFGNFLVQRCFEHGSPEQVIAIAHAIRGNTLNLSMDAFGCHVVQKAFDCVPEEYKAIMVHELLRRIPETVIHRYACHVWQKLFELRWSDSPPQIMKYVNEALRGMWHEVALGETGSLVVQNIFENCLEEDKRPCINEVLASIDVVAHGQFGNWCIQHICEHGSPPDRSRAIDHVLRFATEYSMDQFASKVVEKCLKIGGVDFLDRYLDRVCEARPERPRMPLIDISGDQFGNYLIQYILTNADTQRREVVATHIRKHMVSLRGSKYGSRVAMLCCNPAVATRPGPPVGMPVGVSSGMSGMMSRSTSSDRPYYRSLPYGGNYR